MTNTALPAPWLELFDLAADPGESDEVAARHPEKVAAMQRRVEELAREAVRPLLLEAAYATTWTGLFGSVFAARSGGGPTRKP